MANPSQAVWDYTVKDLFQYQFFKKQDGTYKTVITLLFKGHNEQEFVPDLTIYDQRKTPSGELLNVSEVEINTDGHSPHLGTLEVHGNLKKLSINLINIQNLVSTNFDPAKTKFTDIVYNSSCHKIENMTGPFRLNLFRREGSPKSACEGEAYDIFSVSMNSGDYISIDSLKVKSLKCSQGATLYLDNLQANSADINGAIELKNSDKTKQAFQVINHCRFNKESDVTLQGNFSAGELSVHGKVEHYEGQLNANQLTVASKKNVELDNVEANSFTVKSPLVIEGDLKVTNDLSIDKDKSLTLRKNLDVGGDLHINPFAQVIIYNNTFANNVQLNISGNLNIAKNAAMVEDEDNNSSHVIHVGKNAKVNGDIDFAEMNVDGSMLLDKFGIIKSMSKLHVNGDLEIWGQIKPRIDFTAQVGILVSDDTISSDSQIDVYSNKIHYIGKLSAGKELHITRVDLKNKNVYAYDANTLKLFQSTIQANKLNAKKLVMNYVSTLHALPESHISIQDEISLDRSRLMIAEYVQDDHCTVRNAKVQLKQHSIMTVPSKAHTIPAERLQIDKTSLFTIAK